MLIFTVRLDPLTGTVKEAYALDNKGQIWGRISRSGLPDAQVHTASIVLAGVPGESLKTKVLETVYQSNGIRVLNGYDFLVAKHLRTNVGIFVIDGDFSRSHFKRAISEAKQAGLNSARMYVYGRTATYSGRAICFCKLDEIGIMAPLKPA